jgi:hypothetical protein
MCCIYFAAGYLLSSLLWKGNSASVLVWGRFWRLTPFGGIQGWPWDHLVTSPLASSPEVYRRYRYGPRAARYDFDSWQGQNFSLLHSVQTGSGANPAFYPMRTGSFSVRVKRPGCEANHSPPSSPEIRNCGAIPPLPRHGFTVGCIIN